MGQAPKGPHDNHLLPSECGDMVLGSLGSPFCGQQRALRHLPTFHGNCDSLHRVRGFLLCVGEPSSHFPSHRKPESGKLYRNTRTAIKPPLRMYDVTDSTQQRYFTTYSRLPPVSVSKHYFCQFPSPYLPNSLVPIR